MSNPSPYAGGIQNMAYWIAMDLSKKGRDVVVIGDQKKIPRVLLERHNIELCENRPVRSKLFSDINTALLLLKLRIKYGNNVVLYAMLINNVKMIRMLKIFEKWKCVSFLHGNEVLRFAARRPATFSRNVNFCNTVFVNSNYTKNKALTVDQFKNLVLMHPGINPADSTSDDEKNLRGEKGWNDRKIILMLSRLVARKGHSIVIKAMSRLIPRYPQLLLLIGGTGKYREQIEKQVKAAGLEENVLFLGFVPEDEKSDYFRSCDVYCMPSDIDENSFEVEGFGITFIEAAAAGALAIGSHSGGIPDAIENGKSGFLVDAHDDAQLAVLLDKIFSDPAQFESMRTYARQRALNEFSWSNQVDTILHTIEE
jgi:glycosyltransferase involved in cell wall biosynthesis